MYVVYGLEDQRNHEIFYVGVTEDLYGRFQQHIRGEGLKANDAKETRIREMRIEGYLPLMRTLQIVGDLVYAKARESYWIRHYYDMGMPLTNREIPLTSKYVAVVHRQPYRRHIKTTPAQERAALVLRRNPGISATDLAREIGITSQYAGRLLRRLVGQ